MSAMAPIGFLVLAAGHARRFGSCKLMARLTPVQTVLGQVLDHIVPVGAPVCVVTSEAKLGVLALAEDKRVGVIKMPMDSAGLGESIAYGVAATQHWGGWIVCLGDMPWIDTSLYRQVWELSSTGNAKQVAPIVGERRGHPVFFDKTYAHALRGLSGDKGAASIIDSRALMTFEVGDQAALKDVDTPADLGCINKP